jgi:hypothetical protein
VSFRLESSKGRSYMLGGPVEGVSGAKVRIQTPVAAIGARGTTVWGGPIDNGYGVVVLSGKVTLTTRRGAVTLKQGQRTMLFGDGKPQRAAGCRAGRMKRAVASISFGKRRVASSRAKLGASSNGVAVARSRRRLAHRRGEKERSRLVTPAELIDAVSADLL